MKGAVDMNINNLVETHCHLLPGIDDGAKDLETSAKMAYRLYQQGARKIIVTPHYYSDTISLSDFVANRDRAVSQLRDSLPENVIKIIPAAEVFITSYLFNNDDLSAISFGKENYILIEHPFSCPFEDSHKKRISRLICDYGLTPILVHIERYQALMNNEDTLNELLRMGCLAQANISSFAELPMFQKKKLIKYLKAGKIQLIGSDCHNLTSRSPDYEAGAKVIIKKCGKEKLEELMNNANNLF